MGEFDSTKTRVAPIFQRLQTQDDWLARLLRLPQFGLGSAPERLSASNCSLYFADGTGGKERSLSPPVGLLSWLIRNLSSSGSKSSDETKAKRQALAAGDPATIREALELLRSPEPSSGKGWHILEGPTSPDVYIETDDLLVVIEGKRTEHGPTTSTTFMRVRHQMLRHIDCAYEICGRKQVLGFFIVEAEPPHDPAVPAKWVDYCQKTVAEEALCASLPHRSNSERRAIANGFLGCTTWLAVTQAFVLAEPSQLEVAL